MQLLQRTGAHGRRRARRIVGAAALGALGIMPACSGGGGSNGPLYTGPAFSGAANPLGAKWDWPRIDDEAPYLQRIAGGATFTTIVWCDVQKHQGDSYNWKPIDKQVTATRRLGFQLFIKLRVGSCWATANKGGFRRGHGILKTASAMPVDMSAYESFVRASVQRYAPQGVEQWAVENEVNSPSFWDGTTSQYETLVTDAAAAVHAADPHVLVLGCGISSTAYGVAIAHHLLQEGHPGQAVAAYEQYYTRRFSTRGAQYPSVKGLADLDRVLAGGQAKRDLDFLAAEDTLVRRGVEGAYQLHFYEDWSNVPALLSTIRAALGASVPIEAWEVGDFHSTGVGNEDVGAAEVARATALLLAGGVRRVIWLPLAYNPSGESGEPRLGLLDPSGTVRTEGDVFALLATAATGAAAAPPQRHGLEGVVLTGASGRAVCLVWSSSGTTTLPGPPSGSTARGLSGTGVTWGTSGLRVTSTPVVLDIAGGAPAVTAVVG